MTNDFQPFKQSGFEFVQHNHFAALFLTIENTGRCACRAGEHRSDLNSQSSSSHCNASLLACSNAGTLPSRP